MSPLVQQFNGILQLALKILGGLDWLWRGWRGRARERNYLRRRGRLSFPVVSRLFLLLDRCCFRDGARRNLRVTLLQEIILYGNHAAAGKPSQGLWKNEKLSRLARTKTDRAAIHLSASSPLLDSHNTILFDGALKHFVVFRRCEENVNVRATGGLNDRSESCGFYRLLDLGLHCF